LTTNPEITLAKRADAAEIARLSRVMIEHGLGWSYTPGRIRRAIAHESRNVVVARDNAQLIGFAIMSYKKDSANLDLLGVTRQYRRRGVGESLVSWLEKCATTAGIVHLHVQVRKRNLNAISFYSKFGYAVTSEISGYYAGKEAAIVMHKCSADVHAYPEVDIGRFLNHREDGIRRHKD